MLLLSHPLHQKVKHRRDSDHRKVTEQVCSRTGESGSKSPELCRTLKQTPGSHDKDLLCSGEFPPLPVEFRIGEGIVTLQLSGQTVSGPVGRPAQVAATFRSPAAVAAFSLLRPHYSRWPQLSRGRGTTVQAGRRICLSRWK